MTQNGWRSGQTTNIPRESVQQRRQRQSGKQEAGNTALNLVNRFLSWLKDKLFGGVKKFIKIAASKTYIKTRDGTAELIPETEVPEKHRTQENSSRGAISEQLKSERRRQHHRSVNKPGNSSAVSHRQETWETREERTGKKRRQESWRPFRSTFSDEGTRVARTSTLKDLHSEEVARRATRNVQIRKDVLDNPDLIDADSEWEVELKIDLARGKDITSKIEANPELDMDAVKSHLGLEWIARAGKNAMSTQDMLDTLNGDTDAEPEVDTETEGETSSDTDGEPSSDVETDSDATEGLSTDTSTGLHGSSSDGYTSTLTGTDLSGVSSIDIDTSISTMSSSTDTGSSVSTEVSTDLGSSGTEISTDIGTTGSAGPSTGSGSGTGSGGTGGGSGGGE